MSSATRQNIEELLALSPWLVFMVAAAWCWMLELRDNRRLSRANEREHPSQPEKAKHARSEPT